MHSAPGIRPRVLPIIHTAITDVIIRPSAPSPTLGPGPTPGPGPGPILIPTLLPLSLSLDPPEPSVTVPPIHRQLSAWRLFDMEDSLQSTSHNHVYSSVLKMKKGHLVDATEDDLKSKSKTRKQG